MMLLLLDQEMRSKTTAIRIALGMADGEKKRHGGLMSSKTKAVTGARSNRNY